MWCIIINRIELSNNTISKVIKCEKACNSLNILFRVPKVNRPALLVSRPLSHAAETANGPNIYEICIFVCECTCERVCESASSRIFAECS